MLFIVETYCKEVFLDRLEIGFPKLVFIKYFGSIYTACAYKNNVLTWTYKSGVKCGRFFEKYPKRGNFYKEI